MDNKVVFIALTGRTNVGKSTLMNALLGQKVSIVSKKPQTTRTRITGILTKGDSQYVFLDTPGIHSSRTLLGKYMSKTIKTTLVGADIVMLIVEPIPLVGDIERGILEKMAKNEVPVVIAVNKIDTVKKESLLRVIAAYSQVYPEAVIIPISALKNDGTDLLLREADKYMSEEGFAFDEDMLTDQPERAIASEFIREKMLRLLSDEVPHGIAVVIDEYKDEGKLLRIRATIFCEKETHKGIIIGKNGAMMKKIGTYAREDMEDFFGCKVFLDLWVKVKSNWRDNPTALSSFGFGGD